MDYNQKIFENGNQLNCKKTTVQIKTLYTLWSLDDIFRLYSYSNKNNLYGVCVLKLINKFKLRMDKIICIKTKIFLK